MGYRINTNTAAIYAHMQGTLNNRGLDQSLTRLSSGLRINTAADDASGLVIADSLRAQANSLGQAVANGNDAIGLIQTADGALDEYSKILDTIKTKAIQAASDNQNTASRQAIQRDITRLIEELNNIARTTSFNGQKLLSGTFVNKEFQMGASANESIKASIASAETTQIGQTTRANIFINKTGESHLTLTSAMTGEVFNLETIDLQANNEVENGMGAVADMINKFSGETGITAKAIVKSTTGTAIKAGTTGADFAINGVAIGAINVTVNDIDGTLMNAINAKTTETGIAATKTEDGKLMLTSTDGRAIKVTGEVEDIMGSTGEEMSTFGYLEVVQIGSSAIKISGDALSSAVGGDIHVSSNMITIKDSTLAVGSTLVTDSTLAGGTVLGATISAGSHIASFSSTKDSVLTAGAILGSDTKINDGTTLASEIVTTAATQTLSGDMFIKAGSSLTTGTVMDAGTMLAQDIIVAGVTYKSGTVLAADLTLTSTITLINDMTIHTDVSGTPNAAIGGNSILVAGTVLGADLSITGTSTLGSEMTLKAGSIIASGSLIFVGSAIGDNIIISDTYTTIAVTNLKTGSTLLSGSILKPGSTIGGEVAISSDMSLVQDMLVKSGSMLKTNTVLKAGVVLTQDLTAAQAGVDLPAGYVLGSDVTLKADVYLIKDLTLVKGSGTAGSIAAGSIFALNSENQNSVEIADQEFTNLASVSVTTLKDAMKAIDTVSTAITNLDTIRSGLGSVQNQLISTINNISVTQVNVKTAESQLRDVDFAKESATFSKHNILAQAGSFAMSQANTVQQNVLKLLQ